MLKFTKVSAGHYIVGQAMCVHLDRTTNSWTAVYFHRVTRGCSSRKQAIAICMEQWEADAHKQIGWTVVGGVTILHTPS